MITGFNTDIEHEGVIYHVQTEDKGVSTPLILSLVYNRGTILASKRSPYDDLLVPIFDEKALSERLQKQHKLICAAVRAGRLEDLKRMGKQAAPPPKNNGAQTQVKSVAPKQESPSPSKISNPQTSEAAPKIQRIAPPQKPNFVPLTKPKQPQQEAPSQTAKQKIPPDNRPEQTAPVTMEPATIVIEAKAAKLKENPVLNVPISIVEDEPIIEAVAIIEDEMILPAEAVAVLSDEIDTHQTADNKLKIELPDNVTFRSGERKTVGISVFRGAEKTASSGAHVMIKVFGAAFRPLIFHAKTDERGTANVHLQMPQFKGGRAAILIKAMSDGEETELRRAIVS